MMSGTTRHGPEFPTFQNLTRTGMPSMVLRTAIHTIFTKSQGHRACRRDTAYVSRTAHVQTASLLRVTRPFINSFGASRIMFVEQREDCGVPRHLVTLYPCFRLWEPVAIALVTRHQVQQSLPSSSTFQFKHALLHLNQVHAASRLRFFLATTSLSSFGCLRVWLLHACFNLISMVIDVICGSLRCLTEIKHKLIDLPTHTMLVLFCDAACSSQLVATRLGAKGPLTRENRLPFHKVKACGRS